MFSLENGKRDNCYYHLAARQICSPDTCSALARKVLMRISGVHVHVNRDTDSQSQSDSVSVGRNIQFSFILRPIMVTT